MKTALTLCFLLIFLNIYSQDGKSYSIFDSDGKEVTFLGFIKGMKKADVVLFGELHNNSIGHWLQLQTVKSLLNEGEVTLGAEMFESDDQIVIDEYLNGLIKMEHLEKEAKIWDNFKTDYKPLLLFAEENNIPFVATNIPRRYANLVYREGVESIEQLSEESKKFIAPLPVNIDFELPGYKNMMEMMSSHGNGNSGKNLAASQAFKDATMAHFILKNLSKGIFVHFNGTYHSKNFEGIYHYIKEERKRTKIITIHMVEQEDVSQLQEIHLSSADFIIVSPEDMTRTY